MNQLEGADNNLQNGQIEIKACPNSKNMIEIGILAKKITIDWGDGTIENSIPNNKLSISKGDGIVDEIDGQCFTHEYPNQDLWTIKIDTEEMTMFEWNYWGNPSLCPSPQELRFGNCPELEVIHCNSNQLVSLDVSRCRALTQLFCDNNKLTSLDVSGCPALIDLICSDNQINSLDISNCTDLVHLLCNNNQLIHLDVSKCTDLSTLHCCDNQLTSLDVNNCAFLRELDCSGNLLSSLDVSKCIALTELKCSGNKLSATAINSIFMGLPRVSANIIYDNNSGFDTCDRSIVIMKGWRDEWNYLYFRDVGSGAIDCLTCGQKEENFEPNCSYYQCQSCGKIQDLRGEKRYYIECDCGGLLMRDKPIFCSTCKSKNVKYEYECDDICDDLP